MSKIERYFKYHPFGFLYICIGIFLFYLEPSDYWLIPLVLAPIIYLDWWYWNWIKWIEGQIEQSKRDVRYAKWLRKNLRPLEDIIS